ncbi:MAG: 30S ribosome-binding factor RbfA [Promicromonosporaceae bacterium]|nr:30S ribosome-binding factor RbfA [Promicromonosporaceae bacterium]
MPDNPRALRLADRIKVIVAQLLDTRVKDPRLGFVTITDVRVTGDLQQASVFYTVLGSDEDRANTAAALNSAKGMIRSEVGKQIEVRLTPSIEFHLDMVPETSAHLNAALEEARRRDAELAALRVGKTYAGDADPYKAKEEDISETAGEFLTDEQGFSGYGNGEGPSIPIKPFKLGEATDEAGFAGYDDEH